MSKALRKEFVGAQFQKVRVYDHHCGEHGIRTLRQ